MLAESMGGDASSSNDPRALQGNEGCASARARRIPSPLTDPEFAITAAPVVSAARDMVTGTREGGMFSRCKPHNITGLLVLFLSGSLILAACGRNDKVHSSASPANPEAG